MIYDTNWFVGKSYFLNSLKLSRVRLQQGWKNLVQEISDSFGAFLSTLAMINYALINLIKDKSDQMF